jgi:hypothetical protein
VEFSNGFLYSPPKKDMSTVDFARSSSGSSSDISYSSSSDVGIDDRSELGTHVNCDSPKSDYDSGGFNGYSGGNRGGKLGGTIDGTDPEENSDDTDEEE